MGKGGRICEFAIQAIERARKNTAAPEQWEAMAKTMRKAVKTMKIAGVMQPQVECRKRDRAHWRQRKKTRR
jgi:hypothetical protein